LTACSTPERKLPAVSAQWTAMARASCGPALAEEPDRLSAQRAELGGAHCGDQCCCSLFAAIGLLEPTDRGGGRVVQITPAHQFADHQRERPGGQVTAGMAVGERGSLAAEGEWVVGGPARQARRASRRRSPCCRSLAG